MTPEDKLTLFIDRVLAQLRSPLEAEMHAVAQDFRQEAAASRTRAVEEAVAAVQRESQSELERLRQELEHVRRTTAAEVAEIRQLAAAEIEGARRLAESQVEDTERHSAELIAAARRDADDARAGLEQLQRELGDARQAVADAGRDRVTIQQSLDEVRHAATLASETLSGVAARTQQIVDTVRGIDGATSIGDVLERVAQAARTYAQRSVLLMVRGSGLTVWRTADFPGLGSGTLHVDDGGLIAAAVTERRPRTRLEGTRDADSPLPQFATDARARDAVALPLVLGGEVVAVLYADAPRGGDTSDRRWPLALEVATRYASRVIEAMTLQRSLAAATAAGAPPGPRNSETTP